MSSSVAKPNEAADPHGGQQFDAFFVRQLQRASGQIKLIDLITALAIVLVVLLGGLLAVCVVDAWLFPLPGWFRLAVLCGLVAYAGLVIARHLLPLLLWRINPAYAAQMIEHSSPGLKNSLLNYLFLRSLPAGQRGAVYGAVRQRAAQDLSHITIEASIDRTRLIRVGFALVAVVLAAGMYKLLSPKDPVQSLRRVLAPLADLPAPSRVQIIRVEPGSVELFFGESLEVRAEIRGASDAHPPQLFYSSDDGQFRDAAVPLSPTDGLHQYSGVLAPSGTGIQQSLTYWVVAGDGRSSNYRVQLRPAPTIAVAAVELEPPAYTELPIVRHDGLGDVDGVEGTRVRLTATANLPIASAYLEFLRVRPRDGESPLSYQSLDRLAMTSSGTEARGEFQLPRLGNPPPFTHYRLRFSTAEGQTSGEGSAYAIKIRPDIAPELSLEQPSQPEVVVPESSKLPIVVRSADPDFRLTSVWLYVAHKGKLLLQQNLPFEPKTGQGNVAARFVLRPEAIGLKAGDEAVLYCIAKDNRHSLSGTLDPNQTRSQNYTLKIVTSPKDPARGARNGNSASPSGERPEKGEQSPSDPSDSAGESGKGEPQAGDTSAGEEGEGDQPNGGGNNGSAGGSEEESSSGQNDPASGAGNMSSASGGGDQQSSQPAEQSGGAEGNSPAESSAAGNSGDAAGSQAANPSAQATPSPSAAGDAGQSPAGESNPAEGAEPSNANSSGAAENAPAETSESGRNEDAPLNDFSSDGQRMERLLRRAQDQQQRPDRNEIRSHGGIDEPEQPPTAGANSDPHTPPANQPPAEQPAGNPDGKGERSAGNSNNEGSGNPAAGQNSTTGQRGTPGTKPTESADSQAGDSGQPNSNAAEPGAAAEQSRGEQGDNGSGQMNSGAKPSSTDSPPGGGDSEPNTEPQTGNSQADQGPAGTKHASNSQGNQAEGSGQQTDDAASGKQGEKAPAAEPGDRQPSAREGDEKGTDPQPAADPAGAKGENGRGGSAQGGNPGDESGAGEESPSGGDREPNQPSSDAGQSPPQPRAGDRTPPARPQANPAKSAGSGNSGEAGGAAQGEPNDMPPPGKSSNSDSASAAGNSQSAAAADPAEGMTSPPRGARSSSAGEPKQSGAGSEFNPTSDDPTEKEQLEASRAATELVLDYLRDQQQRPDPSLLNEMNWTEAEMREFLRRWETMRREAESGNADAVKKFEESLRSLGLQTQPAQVRRSAMRNETIDNLQEDSAVSRPPGTRELQFREFLRRRSQADNR